MKGQQARKKDREQRYRGLEQIWAFVQWRTCTEIECILSNFKDKIRIRRFLFVKTPILSKNIKISSGKEIRLFDAYNGKTCLCNVEKESFCIRSGFPMKAAPKKMVW